MKTLHLALSTHDIEASVTDYSQRLGFGPCLVIPGEYALWRNDCINLSVRCDHESAPGSLRHLGHENPSAAAFTETTDSNGITWEEFSAQQQATEIEALWPGSGYTPEGN